MILFILIFSIIFLIFVEIYVGSIMFRYNSENKLSFNLWSGINFLCHPFHNTFLWNKDALLFNYPFMLSLGLLINLIIRYMNRNYNGIFRRTSETPTP